MRNYLSIKKGVHRVPIQALLAVTACLTVMSTGVDAQNGYKKICSASDLHYFAPALLVNDGTAFQSYLDEDRKLIAESKAITAALRDKIYAEAPQIFLVPGDLTKDGELQSHQELAKYLDSIEMNGVTRVFVVPGNHDVNNTSACSYDGDSTTRVDSVSPSDFRSIYHNFGYGEASDTDSVSLSYLAKPSSKVWVLAIDACMYDSNLTRNTVVTAGRIKASTYQWILDRLQEATDSGATVIGLMHHGLTEHYTGQSSFYPEYVVSGWDTLAPNLANAGLKLVFTGHYHANDITRASGTGSNFVYDIETGSTVTWPCPYRVMYLDTTNQTFDITTKLIDAIDYNTNGETFQDYARATLEDGLLGIAQYTLVNSFGLDSATAQVIAPHVVSAFVAHYAGDEEISSDEATFIAYLKSAGQTTFWSMLGGIWSDLNPSDNNVLLDLSSGTAQAAMKYDSYENFTSAAIGTFANAGETAGFDIRETGGSGLFYIPGSDNEFYTLGDRGPNVDAESSAYTLVNDSDITDTKVFPFPSYNPKVFKVALRNDSIVIQDAISLKRPDGTAVTGLPNPPSLGYAGEGVLYENSQAAHDAYLANTAAYTDTLGIDCEGIALGKDNDAWIADEYGVSVWHVDLSTGKLLDRYAPFEVENDAYKNIPVDTILARRRPNRGFENIAIAPSGKVYALLQSPMTNPDKKSRIVRMLEIDPQTSATRMFAYLLPVVDGVSNKDWKLGDMVALNNTEFLVLAHCTGSDTIDRISIIKLDISGATPIAAETYTVSGSGKTLEQLVTGSDESNLLAANNGVADITPVQGSTFLELYNETYPAFPSCKNIWNPAFEKPEGLAVMNDSTVFVTFDNDFGLQSSPGADGTATASNISWQAFAYHLTGDQKIGNFTLDSTIALAMTLVDSNYTVPSWFVFKKAFTTAFASQDSASISALKTAMAALEDKTQPYNVSISINGSPKTQMGFAWFTNPGVTGGQLQIVTGSVSDTAAFASPDITVDATSTTLTNLNYNVAANGLAAYGYASNTKKNYVSCKALATGLTPGTTYSYRVGMDSAWSDIGTFTTAMDGKDEFSFVYFTDPQANSESMFDVSQKTTHAALELNPGANFWLSCGDLIETSGSNNSEWEYEQFFTTQQDIWSNVPFVPVGGNHDKSKNKNFAAHFNTASTSFDQSMATSPGSVYSFAYGDALFMALSYEDYSTAGYLDSLAAWMRTQVESHPELKWKIAFFHKAMYTGSRSHQGDADGKAVRTRMAPLFDSLKIDLALQGHDHIYEVIGPVKNMQLVDTTSITSQVDTLLDDSTNVKGLWGGTFDLTDGTLYFLNNSAGKKKYWPRSEAEMIADSTKTGLPGYFSLFTGRFGQTGEPTFSDVTVTTDTITISTYTVDDDGEPSLFDEFKLTKTIHVEDIALNRSSAEIFEGRGVTLTATITPAIASDPSVTWKSLDEAVATVTNGVVTAVSAGTTQLVAIAVDGELTDTCTITIVAPRAGYVAGDFHQHTTFTDGSYSFDHVMAKNKAFGLDWWANSEHGGGYARNGRVSGLDLNQTVYWDSYEPNPIAGTYNYSNGHQNMWRWQSLRDTEYTCMLAARQAYASRTLLQSYEWNVPGHEHSSMGLIANQFSDSSNCDPLSQFEFMFDGSDADTTGGLALGWTKSSLSGHQKAVEAVTWLQDNYPAQSYTVFAHPERKAKYDINHFRDLNNAGPDVCFGFESMPGHQKSSTRGEYSTSADGGGAYGGCGIYAAKVGGLWDAMLSEGRRFWLFANSDFHSTDGDFYPGEYQKTYTYVTDNADAQAIVDGLRSGNSWIVEGDLVDSLIFNISPASDPSAVASMGEGLDISEKGIDISIKLRDPQGTNNNTYSSYTNPVLHHVDIIAGVVGGKIDPSDTRYSIDTVATTSVIARFDASGSITDASGVKSTAWTDLGNGWKSMTLHLDNVTDSMYFRLRATNLALGVTNETDAAGNPLPDVLMGANSAEKAFADLWMYSNPVFVNQGAIFVDSVSLSRNDLTIATGKTSSLEATVYPDEATDKTVTWSSLDSTTATVSGGVVTALKAGSVKIAVTTTDGGKTDTCLVTVVVPASSVSTSEAITLAVGKTSQIVATVAPDSATDQTVSWQSLDDSVATVTSGTVTGISAGVARVVVTTTDGLYTDTCLVTVVVPAAAIILSNHQLTIATGDDTSITAIIFPANATDQAVEWSSLDESVATVSGGVVSALAAGSTSIVATTVDGGLTDTCSITVVVPVSSVTLSASEKTIAVGKTLVLVATVKPATATNTTVSWISTDTTVATVSGGLVTGVSVGTATIVALSQDGSKMAFCIVSVEVPASSVTIDSSTATLVVGDYLVLTPTILPANTTNTGVTWASSKPSVATVENGLVVALEPGRTTITVLTGNDKYAYCVVTVAAATAAGEVSAEDGIRLFPVPSNGIVFISLPGSLEVTSVTVVNSTGSIVETVDVSGLAQTQVDFSGLAPGTYFAQFRTATGGIISKMIEIAR